jgi:hypothetical protein
MIATLATNKNSSKKKKQTNSGTLVAAETLTILFSEMLKKNLILKIAIENFRNIQSVCRNEHFKKLIN